MGLVASLLPLNLDGGYARDLANIRREFDGTTTAGGNELVLA